MSKVALVTGGNQGLGLALVRRLCLRLGEGGVVHLGARDRERGEAAVELLRAEGLRPRLRLIDVTDPAGVREAADAIRAEHGGIDIVLSNAAARISPGVPAAQQVRGFVDTNNHGTTRMIESFAPLLRDGGRFVVVASFFGTLGQLDERLRPRFREAGSLAEVDRVMAEYVDAVEAGTAAEAGWPDWINIPSKVAQVTSARLLARELAPVARSRDLVVNAVCPGLVDTAASRPWFSDMSQALTPDAAAADVIWPATLPAGETEPYGELVQYRKIVPYEA
ncbi:SDR family NAD(P)-dependent oxidoreductase [Streptomyces sp. NPDC051940]|uniref:SDR family NAD(P)-dependent oxidoreductase n=1 Tax=Streptomyces sp. NPDC051940 TaxID=3155675 RepID=UPI00343A9AF0